MCPHVCVVWTSDVCVVPECSLCPSLPQKLSRGCMHTGHRRNASHVNSILPHSTHNDTQEGLHTSPFALLFSSVNATGSCNLSSHLFLSRRLGGTGSHTGTQKSLKNRDLPPFHSPLSGSPHYLATHLSGPISSCRHLSADGSPAPASWSRPWSWSSSRDSCRPHGVGGDQRGAKGQPTAERN